MSFEDYFPEDIEINTQMNSMGWSQMINGYKWSQRGHGSNDRKWMYMDVNGMSHAQIYTMVDDDHSHSMSQQQK